MLAHGARSLLVKLLDMKMWDGSLTKYYISILVWPPARIYCEILISHSLRIFWIHRILLHGGKPWPKRGIRICLPMRQARILIVFVIANESSTIPSSPTSFVEAISTLSGKYSRIVASSQRISLVALLVGCVEVLRSVDHARSPSFVLFRTMTRINFGRLMCRV